MLEYARWVDAARVARIFLKNPVPAESPSPIEVAGFRFSKPEDLDLTKKKERASFEIPHPFESLNFQEIAETIRDFRAEGRVIGEGNKSDFIVSRDSKKRYGIKHLARPEKIAPYEVRRLKEEADLQWSAVVASHEWVGKNVEERQAKAKPGERVAPMDIAKVPDPYAYVEDPSDPYPDGSPRQYMVMETIRGVTLSRLMYERALNVLLARLTDPDYAELKSRIEKDDISKLSERALMEHLFSLPTFEGMSDEQKGVRLYDVLRGSGLLASEQVRQVQRLVIAMNRKGLFHRDLHERNIIVNPETGRVAVIDFGGAVHDPSSAGLSRAEQKQVVFLVQAGNFFLPIDQDAPTVMTNLTSEPIGQAKPGRRY